MTIPVARVLVPAQQTAAVVAAKPARKTMLTRDPRKGNPLQKGNPFSGTWKVVQQGRPIVGKSHLKLIVLLCLIYKTPCVFWFTPSPYFPLEKNVASACKAHQVL